LVLGSAFRQMEGVLTPDDTVDLARHDGQPVRRKTREIGQEMAVPARYLPPILAEPTAQRDLDA
jgi:hypothetical protein